MLMLGLGLLVGAGSPSCERVPVQVPVKVRLLAASELVRRAQPVRPDTEICKR
jgi:hypothetical protein